MRQFPSDVAFTAAVKAAQQQRGSRQSYVRMEQGRGWHTAVTPELTTFLSGLDMFYLGTANAAGQPYIQYRGGPQGFLQVIDEHTLGFADFGGNRQYITLGNLSENPRAFLFLIDYAQQRRIKLWGTAEVVENAPTLLAQLADTTYEGQPERVILFHLEAWDVNCPQHIHQRFAQAEVEPIVASLKARIAQLEQQLAAAQAMLAAQPTGAGGAG